MSGKTYFSDMGEQVVLSDPERHTKTLPRYGVWTWNPVKRRHEVAEVSGDLEALRAKHGDCPMVDMRPGYARGAPTD